jgi:hypothetical protein
VETSQCVDFFVAQFMKVVIEQLRRNNWTMAEMDIAIHVSVGGRG